MGTPLGICVALQSVAVDVACDLWPVTTAQPDRDKGLDGIYYIYLADFGDILFTIFLQKDPSWDTGYVTNPASFGTAFAQ